jgi:hypothetical protein
MHIAMTKPLVAWDCLQDSPSLATIKEVLASVPDAKHEVTLAYRVTTAHAADCKSRPDLVKQGQANLPEGRIETLAYDKAADDSECHRTLHKAKIRPVIHNRRLWKDQTE